MEGPLVSPGANGISQPPEPSAPAAPIDPQTIVDYLGRLLSVNLGASRDDLEQSGSLLSPSLLQDTLQRCARFAGDSQAALYIIKEKQSDVLNLEQPNGVNTSARFKYVLSSDLPHSSSFVDCVALLKGSQPINPTLPINSQIFEQRLPGFSSASEDSQTPSPQNQPVLFAIFEKAFWPYFNSCTRNQDVKQTALGKGDAGGRTGVSSAREKMEQLKLSMQHMQQDGGVAPISLTLHPVVQNAIEDAHVRKTRPSLSYIGQVFLSDSTFLNQLQNVVNGWIKAIQNKTKDVREPPPHNTASQEITFWIDMEARLEDIEAQLRGEGVQLTMDVLRNAKRFQATTSFSADTGLKETTETVRKYNQLMRDFPIDLLLHSTSLDVARDSIDQIFTHFNKKLRLCPYPIARALPLVGQISAELDTRLHALIDGKSLMRMEYSEFQELMRAAEDVWRTWDENAKEFTNTAREVTRRRNDKLIPIKIVSRHAETQKRLRYINTFRSNHEHLQKTIITVLGSGSNKGFGEEPKADQVVIVEEMGDVDAVGEVAQAYAALKHVDVLDVSSEGTSKWVKAEEIYNERTSRVENSIIARLRDRLATAKNASEMFRVFSKFNALFSRPKIRGAVSEYQTQLIENVKNDISALHDRFKEQYGNSEAHAMAQLRDIPPVSGAIHWARQIERQLDGYMKKVEDILGSDWSLHSEGEKLMTESKMFRSKLETRPIYESWLKEVSRRNIGISGRLFNISRNRAAGKILEISVNFDPQVITLFKEVRNLTWLSYQVPHAINNISKEAKRVYPYAVSMMESVRTYQQTARVIDDMTNVSVLLNGYRNEVQTLIVKGVPLRWESFVHAYDLIIRPTAFTPFDRTASAGRGESKHVQFVREFGEAVTALQNKTSKLSAIDATIQKVLSDLESCSYQAESFRLLLDTIQKAVDQLNLENFVNLTSWVRGLNLRIEAILLHRLEHAVGEWVQIFNAEDDLKVSKLRGELPDDEGAPKIWPELEKLVHELTMRNQVIYLDPPLEFAKARWLNQFQLWVGVICTLPRVQASRYELRLDTDKDTTSDFSELPSLCTRGLRKAYEAMEDKFKNVSEYVDKWLQFQSLWDLKSEHVHDILGEDLSKWLQLLQEIRKTRTTFDTSEVSRSFNHLMVDYEQVQVKVNAKYDQWQHDILAAFATRLGGRMSEVHTDVEKSRKDLETQSLEASSTALAVTFITTVDQCRKKAKIWAPEIDLFFEGQKTLSRQRFQFPPGWIPIDQIRDEWSMFNEILERKDKSINDQRDALRAKIITQDKVLTQKIADIKAQWSEDKPRSGSILPDEAQRILQSFDTKLTSLRDEAMTVAKAKESLDLPPSSEDALSTVLEEVQDFKSVWASLAMIWTSLNELRETNWSSVQPRKLRQSLDNLIKMTKEMPSRMRQYEAFEHFQNILRQLLKVNPLLTEMRSEAVRERHWIKIYKLLKPSKRFSALNQTLGDVWDLQLGPSEKIIRDVIVQAQGEMALEEFLRQVRETWQDYTLELVNYQNKCRLIRGWDDLFAKCSENLNSLQAMKHSPYYKEFEEDASSWEEKLNRVHVLFDVWINVQRQWVYLEGVFTGNADIKHLLPMESSRFQNINSEFLTVMKKVSKSPHVLEVLAIPGAQKSLDRLAELLNKIQKALGEYLERERVAFPRFYFVGDEDLLEIIGNSSDTIRIEKHLRKMFAGISGLITDDDSVIHGFVSKEGEEVALKKPISLVKIPRVNEWLAALESSMKTTLAELLEEAVQSFTELRETQSLDPVAFDDYIQHFPAQIVVLATQICWTNKVEAALDNKGVDLPSLFDQQVNILKALAASVLGDLDPLQRKKCEHLITECVHQRDAVEKLVNAKADSTSHYSWLLQMRYFYSSEGDALQRLRIKMANADLDYGFEYLGVPERLVRTPLTDRCFLTLTQALCQRLGGSPYGPAGTGKTESVKALGLQLGRFTLVFCCDDTFDFQAMGRIFHGICQVGAWGCFDEFNRLEERILSAVSQQVQNIQMGLRKGVIDANAQIELLGRNIKVSSHTGIFITMNPGYAGRSNLPDNLKKLFRSVAMSKPDKELIAEVMLYSQGFSQAKELSRQVVPFFDRCLERLSKQTHYDFGLRALKSVLVSSGGLKRAILSPEASHTEEAHIEPQIIVQSLRETMAPKLIRDDVEIMKEIQAEAFPGIEYVPAGLEKLQSAIRETAAEMSLVVGDAWMTKILQLYQIQGLHHGLMLVGPSGVGKSSAWKVLLQALQKVEGVEGVCHVIDPKVMSKEDLYGSLDSTTREWTDGLFTSILRKIVDNLRGEDSKRHWIVFDGDVDPEWVENLNSVLDDNKLLTLPNGERLNLPPNVRIMFEVETLKYATLATVSRCGMVWFSDDTVATEMMVSNYIEHLRKVTFDDLEDDSTTSGQLSQSSLAVQGRVAELVEIRLTTDYFLEKALATARGSNHIMEYTDIRALNTLFSLLSKICRAILEYNIQHSDFPLDEEQIESFVSKKLLLAIVWSLTGDCPLSDRRTFGNHVASLTTVELPLLNESSSLIDFDVSLPRGDWTPWQSQVPSIEVNTHSVTQTDVVIPTLDTVRHEDVLYSWLAEHKPLLLCGPPGSGKTMTLFSALRKLPNLDVVGLNFSSATTPDLLIKTFEQYCEYKKTLNGVVLSPTQIGRWLVIFCDEINLPAPDKYGTQRAISFLRQLVEQNGFWRTSDRAWVTLDRIQFVGACNPPTDAGRTPMGLRFLRHAPLIMVDYPGDQSLLQIYGTFNAAVLKIIPTLRGYAEPLTKAMVQLYSESQKRFTPEIQPHYVYSPRELTRWVRGVYEAIRPLENLSLEGLVRIWAHEALRLFQDRLIAESEREWTDSCVRRVALENFPTINEEQALGGPILFSNWLSKNYVPVRRDELRDFVKARLKTFCEEEVDVPLILFNDVLGHVLRIDRVFRQSQGHLILIGVSGSGKTTLSRFVAWMNGLKVFQIKVHSKYTAEDFDEDLRNVLRRCGCKGEKICFIMDESNVLDSGFLERMNTLLANAEVPGLFEGDEYAALMTACKEGAQRQGLLLDSQEELYKWFTQQIVKNLHVVFTMNPPEEGLSSRAATSPALFNRCVLNWFGDWSEQAFYQVGSELTQSLDLDRANYISPDSVQIVYSGLNLPLSHREAVVNAMVYIHDSLHRFNNKLQKLQNRVTYLTPRHFLDFVAQFVKLYSEKRDDLEEQQRHLNVGLDKLKETFDKVKDLRHSLAQKTKQLEHKDAEANEKLQRMMDDQKIAEQEKSTALELQTQLEKQKKEISARREVVEIDLAKAEPAVRDAEKAVSNIKRQHLTEVRSMQNPPAGVKLALESVCTLLGHKVDNWKAIVAVVRRDDFIASIVQFDNEKQMTASHRRKMRSEFLSKEDFTFERVNRASKACGPLVQWVEAQVNFSEILDRVGPLREEVQELEEKALSMESIAKATQNKVKKLEQSIEQYKTEYAALIRETESIKSEMNRVQTKVDRSERLLQSLSSERSRWEDSSKSFETQIDTIIGDVLVASAFLAYGGYYDQQYRKAMTDDWTHQLSQSGIHFKSHNPVTEYLSTADERIRWQENALPVDDLCTENAIILKKFNRYPLIIDPSGRVIEFLEKESKDHRLIVTSFLDDSFTKQLESSLRFGNTILIQDAEYMDPILNHVLNKEYQKTGGRVLVQLGKQEIDFSPSFKLYLSTRDPSAKFAPDICSRTTFVNFTVTQSSLQTQTLNEVLKSEQPEIDERRSNLIKLQGEFNVHLRQLEKRLLQALNESRGNILDDDNVIETLERLKREAADITEKAANTEGVMAEVEKLTVKYTKIARSCSAIFAVLEQLHHLNHFYQFSLAYFIDIFDGVLHRVKREGQNAQESARIEQIIQGLFVDTYKRTSLGLLQKDRVTLALLLVQAAPYKMDKTTIDTILDADVKGIDVSTNKESKAEAFGRATKLAIFKGKLDGIPSTSWDKFFSEELAENYIPTAWDTSLDPKDQQLRSLVVVKLFRLDRFVPAVERFVSQVFGVGLLDADGNLGEIVRQAPSPTPVALVSSPGFDASYKVDNLVQSTQTPCTNIAMGSDEGSASADKAISNAAATGSWVFIKNVHLAPSWLQSLEKRIGSLKPHSDFRLFLSMEMSSKIPVNLLRASQVLMYEQPAGIRANMRDSMSTLATRAVEQPVERARVYLLLAFLHAVAQERLRYAPSLGWNGFWEFNDSDYECCSFIIDTWIQSAAGGRTNIAPKKIPWDIIRVLVAETYGGKIDDEADFRAMESLVASILVPAAFEENFVLVRGDEGSPAALALPSATGWRDFVAWVRALPEREPPTFLGLPPNAEKLLLVGHAEEMIRNMSLVMGLLDEGEQIMAEAETEAQA